MIRVPFNDLTPTGRLALELQDAYHRVMTSGQYIRGREVEAFEEEWAGYIGTKHCVGCASGTQALRGILRWFEIFPITVPDNSSPTQDALWDYDLKKIPTSLDSYVWDKAKSIDLIVPVHLYGHPANMDRIESKAAIIEDCAQAHGARYKGRMCGSLADAGAWSFYPTKNLGAYGDAGAVTTDKDGLADLVRAIPGFRMDPLQAAFLRVKLPYLDGWNARRTEIAQMYLDGLAGVEEIGLPVVREWAEPCWHLFTITYHDRDMLQWDLAQLGVETLIRYKITPNVISLPCGPHLTDEQVQSVIEKVKLCVS